MNRLIIKIVLAIAIGVLIGTVLGNLESNKTVTYFEPTAYGIAEISKDRYESDLNDKSNINDSV